MKIWLQLLDYFKERSNAGDMTNIVDEKKNPEQVDEMDMYILDINFNSKH